MDNINGKQRHEQKSSMKVEDPCDTCRLAEHSQKVAHSERKLESTAAAIRSPPRREMFSRWIVDEDSARIDVTRKNHPE